MNGFIIMLVRCCSRFAVRSAALGLFGTRALRLLERGDYTFAAHRAAATGRNE